MTLDFAFGKNGLPLHLPDGFDYRILEARSAKPVLNALAAVEAALDHPIAGSPFSEVCKGKVSAAISVCDITRPAPNKLTLPPILKRMEQAGIAQNAITILSNARMLHPFEDRWQRQLVRSRARNIANRNRR